MKLVVVQFDNKSYLVKEESSDLKKGTLRGVLEVDANCLPEYFPSYLKKEYKGELGSLDTESPVPGFKLTDLNQVKLDYEIGLFKAATADAVLILICNRYDRLRGTR